MENGECEVRGCWLLVQLRNFALRHIFAFCVRGVVGYAGAVAARCFRNPSNFATTLHTSHRNVRAIV